MRPRRRRRGDVAERLRGYRAPGEEEARVRALDLARSAYEESERRPPPRLARRPRLAIALAAALLGAAALALTPAGASVRDLLRDAVGVATEPDRPALTRLPAPGKLLTISDAGAWVVERDGSRRLLGDYDGGTWSPSARFVAVTRGRQLVAVEPDGDPRWSLSRAHRISDPRWAAPSGFRIAYRSGRALHVVAGDGADDHVLARNVAPIAPAWRPGCDPADEDGGRCVLAFAERDGRVIAIDADSGKRLWRTSFDETPLQLEWLADRRVLVATSSAVRILDRDGSPALQLPQPAGTAVELVAASPRADRVAIVRRASVGASRGRSELVLAQIEPGRERERQLFGPGRFTDITFAPDGQWLLLGWREADQWLFMRPRESEKVLERVIPVGDIARQFDPGSVGRPPFPTVAGWCCP